MRYFLDTEFVEDGKSINLLSIGVVADNGDEFYAINSDADHSKANDWVKQHVIPQLYDCVGTNKNMMPLQTTMTRKEIAQALRSFIRLPVNPPAKNLVFWGYFSSYDWVAVCQLFGTMMDLPQGWPMYCRDLKQLADFYGIETNSPDEVHNALFDARWIRSKFREINRIHQRRLKTKVPFASPELGE